jgi:hypothetical protein
MKFVTVNDGGHTFKFYLNHYFDENSKRGDSAKSLGYVSKKILPRYPLNLLILNLKNSFFF